MEPVRVRFEKNDGPLLSSVWDKLPELVGKMGTVVWVDTSLNGYMVCVELDEEHKFMRYERTYKWVENALVAVVVSGDIDALHEAMHSPYTYHWQAFRRFHHNDGSPRPWDEVSVLLGGHNA